MSNFIQVRAFNHGHAGTYTPNRFWPNGEVRRLEVVEDEVAIKQLDKLRPLNKGMPDHGARAMDVAGGPYLPNSMTPDPDRITRSGVDAIRKNPHLSTLGDAEASGAMAAAALDAARATATRANERAADAEIEAAQATQKVEQLEKDLKKASEAYGALSKTVAGLQAENEQLKAKLAALAPAETVDGQVEGGKAKGDKGKDKGGK